MFLFYSLPLYFLRMIEYDRIQNRAAHGELLVYISNICMYIHIYNLIIFFIVNLFITSFFSFQVMFIEILYLDVTSFPHFCHTLKIISRI